MPILSVPNSVSFHHALRFFSQRGMFRPRGKPILEFHDGWVHLEPVGLAAVAAWGAYWRRQGLEITLRHPRRTAYASRMRLFDHLGLIPPQSPAEHEEAGRFLPLTRVRSAQDIKPVIGDVSAMLHLQDDPESLAAVQYCVSELLRNVLEHSASPDGAFVCAHRFRGKTPRISIAVADCGQGVRSHLSQAHAGATTDARALQLALTPGVTGALAGMYGTPDNAGAGLFITRCIAKGTGGYFFIASGSSAYRLRRGRTADDQIELYGDAFEEPRCDVWRLPASWPGTVVATEVRTDMIADYHGFFEWIFAKIPARSSYRSRIRFS